MPNYLGPDPYGLEAEDIQRKQQYAQLLRQQAGEPIQPARAGNMTAPISITQGLAKLLQGYGAGQADKQASEQAKALQSQRQERRGADVSMLANALRGRPATPAGISEDASGNVTPTDAMPAQTPMQSFAQAAPMIQDPSAMQFGFNMLGLQQKEQEGVETRKARLQERAMALEARAQDRAASEAERAQARAEAAQLRRELQSGQQAFQAQMAAEARANRPPPQPRSRQLAEIVDPNNPNRMIRVDIDQFNEQRYRAGDNTGVIGVAGKEPTAAKRSEKEDQGKELLTSELDNLRTSFKLLNDARAIPSSDRSGLSNAAAWVQSSGVGQLGGRMMGTKEQDARNLIQSARLRLLNAIKNATGMSAQQLNSNVELQTWLNSMTDMQGSYESNMGILDAIENAFLRGGQRGGSGAAPQPIPDEPPPGAVRPRNG